MLKDPTDYINFVRQVKPPRPPLSERKRLFLDSDMVLKTIRSDGIIESLGGGSVGQQGPPGPAGATGATGAAGVAPARAIFTSGPHTIASGATGNFVIACGKTFNLLRCEIDFEGRVRFYSTSSKRTDDAGRAIGTAPASYNDVLAEFIMTTGDLNQDAYNVRLHNSDGTPTTDIYVALTNTTGASHNYTLEIEGSPIES